MSRYNRMVPLSALMPGLPTYERPGTLAPWPIWSGSCAKPVRFGGMPKKQAVKLYHQARVWNRQRRARGYGGALGSAAMRVLESLLFDFLNFRSGRLDPSYEGIARKTGLGRSTVAVALARLKELGIITWLRRCTEDRVLPTQVVDGAASRLVDGHRLDRRGSSSAMAIPRAHVVI
jgi:hypothetical protein